MLKMYQWKDDLPRGAGQVLLRQQNLVYAAGFLHLVERIKKGNLK